MRQRRPGKLRIVRRPPPPVSFKGALVRFAIIGLAIVLAMVGIAYLIQAQA